MSATQFHIGDFVVHPMHGIGRVAAIQEMEFVADKQTLFYQVGFDNKTVWVQVQDGEALRAVTLKAALAHYRDILESPPVPMNSDFHVRQRELADRLKDHSFQNLCEVVRDLNALSKAKVLNNYERGLFKRTSATLQQEWAVASGMPLNEAVSSIEAMLQKGANRTSSAISL